MPLMKERAIVSLYMDLDDKLALEGIASNKDRSLSAEVRELVKQRIKQERAKQERQRARQQERIASS